MNQYKRILFFSYYFPPIKSTGSMRNYFLHIELKKHFNQVHVITTKNCNFLGIEYHPTYADSIKSVTTVDYRKILNIFFPAQTHFSEEKKAGWKQYLVKLNRSFPLNLIWGEGGLIYSIASLIHARKLIKNKKISYIYSSFLPYSDHFSAFLTKFFFPKLIWIADFRDLHVDPIYEDVFFKKFQHWCNRKIVSKADMVTTVSHGLATHLTKYNPEVWVMRNGIGKIEAESIKPIEKQNKFTISYTGSLFKNERNPVLLLKALRSLIDNEKIMAQNIQIRYAGKDWNKWISYFKKYQLEKIAINEGIVSTEDARKIQKTSHLNLLLSSSSPSLTGVMTGKFYEYLASGNPILLILNGTKDLEFENIFEKLNAGLVVYHPKTKVEDIEKYLYPLYLEWQQNGIVATKTHTELLSEYEWENLANNFVNRLTEITKKQKY